MILFRKERALNGLVKKYIAEFVYGAIDGTITTFAVIGGVYGAKLSPVIILILGISNVLADGFSMAASNYLSKKSEYGEPGEKALSPIKCAFATFSAFVLVGLIPLLPFIIAFGIDIRIEAQFIWSMIATACAFIATGLVSGYVSNKNIWKRAVETLIIGGIAAIIAYAAGVMLRGLA